MGIECQEVSGMMKYIRIGMLSFQIHIYAYILYIHSGTPISAVT